MGKKTTEVDLGTQFMQYGQHTEIIKWTIPKPKKMNVKNKIFFGILLCISLCYSCKKATMQSPPSSDINTFKKYVDIDSLVPRNILFLKYKKGTEESVFSEAPEDYVLKAVLQFNEKDWLYLKKKYGENSVDVRDKIYLDSNFITPWFPEIVKQNFVLNDNFLRPTCDVYNIKQYLIGNWRGECFFLNDNYIIILAENTP
jgi:hypothetical protein